MFLTCWMSEAPAPTPIKYYSLHLSTETTYTTSQNLHTQTDTQIHIQTHKVGKGIVKNLHTPYTNSFKSMGYSIYSHCLTGYENVC